MSQSFEQFYGLNPNSGSLQEEKLNSDEKSTVNHIIQDMSLLHLRTRSYPTESFEGQISGENARNASSSYFYESQASNELLQTNSNLNILSDIEAAILRSSVPIDLNETEEITVNGERGIWANKSESSNWRGSFPITQYPINDDPSPEIIRKRSDQQIVYQQEIAIRYLRPPTPPAPGEILIHQEENILTPPAPPLVIRQQPPRPSTPAPLVIRETPPQPPPSIGRKIITISGKRLPPPPRKVIIERLPPLPNKPQSIIIERWLPYKQIKRKIVYIKPSEKDLAVSRPKNIVIQWEQPKVVVKKEFKDLGIVRANPIEYVQRYGQSLKRSIELPNFVKEIKPPSGVVLAAEQTPSTIYELEGDIYALNLVDLEREGLVEYRYLIKQSGLPELPKPSSNKYESSLISSESNNLSLSVSNSKSTNLEFVNELFRLVDLDSNNTISISDAEKLLLRLYSRLGKKYGEEEANSFFQQVDFNSDGRIDFNEFKRVFAKTI